MRILLKGFVADGTAEPVRKALLVENDRIIAVENDIYGASAADKILTFKDEIIAPGFIDVHGHSDISLLASPEAESKCCQGITAEITGNCGLSAFPITSKNREHLESLYANYGVPLEWRTLSDYKNVLQKTSPKLRSFSLCGHNTLRSAVMGYDKKDISFSDLQKMGQFLEDSLAAGSPGLSTGLLYTPGCFAEKDEITALMRVLAKHDAVYATHLRSEGDNLLESLEETFSAAADAGLKKIQISHFKTAGKSNWHKLPAALELIANYREQGIDIRFDRYPYTESQTMLSVILPPPFDTMPDRDITIKLQDAALREELQIFLTKEKADDWSRWRLTGTTHPVWKKFIGKKYTELPGEPAIAVIDQLFFDATTATIGAAGMSDENMIKIITHPLCMGGSDGNALPLSSEFGTAHPRAFGAIAKFIRLKLDSGESIGKTVSSVTGTPADFFSLNEIGKIQCGKKADICVFSPEEIDSKADFSNPHCLAEGIRLSMLDGKIRF